VNTFQQDVRYAVRQLRNTPGFACAAAATLAIGIGATTAIFTIVDAVLLRPLPFPHSEQLVDVRTRLTDGRVTTGLLSAAELTALNESHLPLRRAAGVEAQPFDATLLRDDGTAVHILLRGVTEGECLLKSVDSRCSGSRSNMAASKTTGEPRPTHRRRTDGTSSRPRHPIGKHQRLPALAC
jgi:hypothetical protein